MDGIISGRLLPNQTNEYLYTIRGGATTACGSDLETIRNGVKLFSTDPDGILQHSDYLHNEKPTWCVYSYVILKGRDSSWQQREAWRAYRYTQHYFTHNPLYKMINETIFDGAPELLFEFPSDWELRRAINIHNQASDIGPVHYNWG